MKTDHESTNPFEVLAREAKRLEREHETGLEAMLGQLESLDLQLTRRALDVWDNDRRSVASWLATDHPLLQGNSPYRAIAIGKRQEVFDLLAKIFYGIPP